MCLAPSEIVRQVRELVWHERNALQAHDSCARAEFQMQAQAQASKYGDDLQLQEQPPGELLPSLLAHFQRLFDVRGVQGVLPKMNELYLHSQEHANFTKALKGVVGVEPGATFQTLLSAVRQLAESGAGGATGGGDASDGDGDLVVDGNGHLVVDHGHMDGGDGGDAGDGGSGAGGARDGDGGGSGSGGASAGASAVAGDGDSVTGSASAVESVPSAPLETETSSCESAGGAAAAAAAEDPPGALG